MYPTYKPHRNLHISVSISIIYNHQKMGDNPFVFQWVNGSGVGGPAIAETLLLHTAWMALRCITQRDRDAWAHFHDILQDKITGWRTQQRAPSAGKGRHDYKRAGDLGDVWRVPCVDCRGGYSTLHLSTILKLHAKMGNYLLHVNYTSREKKNKWASTLC